MSAVSSGVAVASSASATAIVGTFGSSGTWKFCAPLPEGRQLGSPAQRPTRSVSPVVSWALADPLFGLESIPVSIPSSHLTPSSSWSWPTSSPCGEMQVPQQCWPRTSRSFARYAPVSLPAPAGRQRRGRHRPGVCARPRSRLRARKGSGWPGPLDPASLGPVPLRHRLGTRRRGGAPMTWSAQWRPPRHAPNAPQQARPERSSWPDPRNHLRTGVPELLTHRVPETMEPQTHRLHHTKSQVK